MPGATAQPVGKRGASLPSAFGGMLPRRNRSPRASYCSAVPRSSAFHPSISSYPGPVSVSKTEEAELAPPAWMAALLKSRLHARGGMERWGGISRALSRIRAWISKQSPRESLIRREGAWASHGLEEDGREGRTEGGTEESRTWRKAARAVSCNAQKFFAWCNAQRCRPWPCRYGQQASPRQRASFSPSPPDRKASASLCHTLGPRLVPQVSFLLLFVLFAAFLPPPLAAQAMALPSPPTGDGNLPSPSGISPWQRGLIFATLFVISAAFHAAETSITTLYPWKVKEFAKEEGDNSPFRILERDITRVLTTILVATTACTIYSAALFTNLAMELLGARGVAYSTVGLTVVTLVFGELIPKSLGVSNAEMVARIMVPPINLLAVVLSPVGKVLSMFAKLVLRLLGIKADDDERVSEDQLRLLVAGAQKSGGIEAQEGQMINQVLNMQEKRVSEAMCPRVDVEALDKRSSLLQLQELFQRTRYSRIPVFDGEIDKIIGVAMSKDLLEYVFSKEQSNVLELPVETIMQPTYFVPETMTIWTCFQEMRQRRVHMAIVVDEYGGTAGVITLEDIQEEVFGEIYDEEDIEEDHHGEDLIKMIEDDVYLIQGNADLEDVWTELGMEDKEEVVRGDFATFGGYLCSLAGEIPAVSDHIVVPGYIFTIEQADERRIIEVRVERVYVVDGGEDEEREGEEEEREITEREEEEERKGSREGSREGGKLREKVE
ncbi:hypothetical protein NSK_007589 [Nannochloropsis salina CCMP1776]|uniref:CNNM transmembrane domain-containing protein n=1 Tax=Nannochloropsis salina CCMP1776 TaxID=1027361 RepID=A0A4D9CQB2_9STRA|nr:hypothetical protein NSK_007589 [Nannochloropsis salina CCMP1776]|eukprot:TFJ80946.1 hypothetical protein NSK_007589 [Nannochloropsis salina CCMP1776]